MRFDFIEPQHAAQLLRPNWIIVRFSFTLILRWWGMFVCMFGCWGCMFFKGSADNLAKNFGSNFRPCSQSHVLCETDSATLWDWPGNAIVLRCRTNHSIFRCVFVFIETSFIRLLYIFSGAHRYMLIHTSVHMRLISALKPKTAKAYLANNITDSATLQACCFQPSWRLTNK